MKIHKWRQDDKTRVKTNQGETQQWQGVTLQTQGEGKSNKTGNNKQETQNHEKNIQAVDQKTKTSWKTLQSIAELGDNSLWIVRDIFHITHTVNKKNIDYSCKQTSSAGKTQSGTHWFAKVLFVFIVSYQKTHCVYPWCLTNVLSVFSSFWNVQCW